MGQGCAQHEERAEYEESNAGEQDLLSNAAANGDLARLKNLLKTGANPNNEWGRYANTAIHEAASGVCAKELLAGGANVHHANLLGDTPVHTCCFHAEGTHGMLFAEVLQVLLAAKADPGAVNNNQETPLHYAGSSGCMHVVGILVKAGANVNSRDVFGQTPLHHAALADRNDDDEARWATCKELCKYGADTNAKDENGRRPKLNWATLQNRERGR